MTEKDINQIINKIKTYQLSIQDIPKDIAYQKNILKAERELGLRCEGKRGYNVITDCFFVEEVLYSCEKDSVCNRQLVQRCEVKSFDTFAELYDFLDGDIYTDGCYQYYDFGKEEDFIREHAIDVKKLQERTSFISQTMDEIRPEISKNELEEYQNAEKIKAFYLEWIDRFDACKSGEELNKIINEYEINETVHTFLGYHGCYYYYHIDQDIMFFLCHSIISNPYDEEKFRVVMDYVSNDYRYSDRVLNLLCMICDPHKVEENYHFPQESRQRVAKLKRNLKSVIYTLETENIRFRSKSYFDRRTLFYCDDIDVLADGRWILTIPIRYSSYNEYIKYKKGDLSGCDLSGAIMLDVDFSKYKTDKNTKLPPICTGDYVRSVEKWYRDGEFNVSLKWNTYSGCSVYTYLFSTLYFFDFVYFLKNDLSSADLLLCEGLANLDNLYGIDFTGAKIPSELCERFGVSYKPYSMNTEDTHMFAYSEENEKGSPVLAYEEHVSDVNSEEYCYTSKRISYITDIHLMHTLGENCCRSWDEVVCSVRKITDIIALEANSILLIGGDVASNFEIFRLFVVSLKQSILQRKKEVDVVFILGNHELWDFAGKFLVNIVEVYREFIIKNGMYLLQNDLLYLDASDGIHIIPYKELMEYLSFDSEKLNVKMRKAELVILGAIGFSGYNMEFNACNGIYRNTLKREEEICETEKFENLYFSLLPFLCGRNTVIFTHMPLKDWCMTPEYQPGFVYVSGHTHRNEFHEDSAIYVYSDNQVGYHNNNPHLKNFLVDGVYDVFLKYSDGIYEISRQQYMDFYRGLGKSINFFREINILYMLKKHGYYCFIHQAVSGSLTILNGGGRKKLEHKDIHYYFDHMDRVISYIRKPLDKYMDFQTKISREIKKIGGAGTIHGCIIDIDWNCHVYVNPLDMKVTAYWAEDIKNKKVYKDIPTLLKQNCRELYSNYRRRLKENKNAVIHIKDSIIEDSNFVAREYLETDIYRVSREMKKMQKLENKVLATWHEDLKNETPNQKSIEDKV